LILESYGEKSEDGRFVKEDRYGRRLSSFFKVSEAWDAMFMNLVKNENELREFLKGIVPKDVADAAEEEAKKLEGQLTPVSPE
jgi:hypothetical protein